MADSSLPSHLLPLGAGRWALWRRNGLRSAGLPVTAIETLGDPVLTAAVERALDAEDALEAARAAACAAVDEALDTLRNTGGWDEPERRKPLLAARKAATRGAAQTLAALGFAPHAAALETAQREHARAQAELEPAFERAFAAEAEALHRAARDPRFREAVIWQNRAAFHTGVEPVAAQPPDGSRSNAERRYAEKMVASYLQRYAVKNDTIGFFGPSAPFEFAAEGPALVARPGRGLIASSKVFFEAWCLEELARPFARQEVMRPFLCPLRSPLARLEGRVLRQLGQPPQPLSAAQAAVFAACDGTTTARDVARVLCADPSLGLADAKAVYALLDALVRQELVSWGFALPSTPAAAAAYAAQIAAIAHPKLRAVGEHTLGALEKGRAEVAACLGDAAALDHALEKLEGTFQRLTGQAPTRRAGQVYGGRTLVYLDCVRDVEVVCGPALLQELAAPLAIVLDAARWLTGEVANATRRVFAEIFRDLGHGSASRPGADGIEGSVEGTAFTHAFTLRMAEPGFLEPEGRRLAERWQQLLGVHPGQRRLALSSRELAARAAELFACAEPGWPQARCHSPDLMVTAASPEAVCAGDYELVLGEVHVGVNTLNSWAFLGVWPEAEALCRQLELDVPETRFLMAGSKNLERTTTRTSVPYNTPQELVVLTHVDPVLRDPGRELAATDLVIEQEDGRLIARTRDGRRRVDVMTGFGARLSALATSVFGVVPPARHWPRITLDRLVIHRESWRIPAEETLVWASAKTTAERFRATRRWLRGLGMPRRVFVKSPLERKPIYVDLESPTYVDLLARLAARTAAQSTAEQPLTLSFSEMLPAPDQTWLRDAEGRRYTSELRLVAIDRSTATD